MLKRRILIAIAILFLIIPFTAGAVSVGERVDFYVDSQHDLFGREEISVILEKITNQLYFYVEESWWGKLDEAEQREIGDKLYNLGNEFEREIYPTLTSTFGSEPKPGIDKDEKITVLVHRMIKEAGGYFDSANCYSKFQIPTSNEREMIYLNSRYIDSTRVKSFLAHEFIHLITFNQKDEIREVSEEIWLNEARAEYAPTFLGYDEDYEDSNLQSRVEYFLKYPNDSLTEWQNKISDYGALNLFFQYLVDHYGIEILADSLFSNRVGISSLNYALAKNRFSEDFSQVFTDWTITVLVNDCSLGKKYCYKNPNLETFRITPQINFLPLTGESILAVTNMTSDWAGNWQKIVGGKGTLTLEFDGDDRVTFNVPYVVCEDKEGCSVDFLVLNGNQEGKIVLSEFDEKYTSLTIIPSVQSKISGFDGKELSYSCSFKVSTSEKTEKEEELIEELLAQIEYLQREIARVQAQINTLLAQKKGTGPISCQKIEKNLYYGMKNNSEIRCLQEFLKTQGSEIYPEGLVTGNFLALTKAAVIRFQEKYVSEILAPWGLTEGTGFVGKNTRAKINETLGQ